MPIQVVSGTPGSGMSYEPVKLLPFRPSCPRCPTCKAFIGVNPVGEWSRCNSCGTSFHDLDFRYALASALSTKFIPPEIVHPENSNSFLLPNGKIRKSTIKAKTSAGQLDLFGGAL